MFNKGQLPQFSVIRLTNFGIVFNKGQLLQSSVIRLSNCGITARLMHLSHLIFVSRLSSAIGSSHMTHIVVCLYDIFSLRRRMRNQFKGCSVSLVRV